MNCSSASCSALPRKGLACLLLALHALSLAGCASKKEKDPFGDDDPPKRKEHSMMDAVDHRIFYEGWGKSN